MYCLENPEERIMKYPIKYQLPFLLNSYTNKIRLNAFTLLSYVRSLPSGIIAPQFFAYVFYQLLVLSALYEFTALNLQNIFDYLAIWWNE